MASQGFEIADKVTAPMKLLAPQRVIEDEGVAGALHLAGNLMLNSTARQRFLSMKNVFYQDQYYLQVIL